MALIKAKQIEPIPANHILESDIKKFVSQDDIDKWNDSSDSILNSHSHDNKDILDKISLDSNGLPLFDGQSLIGQDGEQGPQGEQGIQGPQGDIGPQGPAGQDGITPDISHLATKQDLDDAINSLEFPDIDLSDYYTKQDVDNLIPDVSNLVTNQDLNDALDNIIIPDIDNIPAEKIIESDNKQFVSKEQIDKWNNCSGGSDGSGGSNDNIDLSNYYTKQETYNKSEVDTLIPDISNLTTKQDLDDAINNLEIPDVDLSNYYTKQEIYNKSEVDDYIQDIRADLEQIPGFDADLSIYALKDNTYTKQEVDNLIPDISNLTTKQELESAINNIEFPDIDNIPAENVIESESKQFVSKEQIDYWNNYRNLDSDNNAEYGVFGLNAAQTTGLTTDSIINFDRVLFGNMSISDGTVKLKKGKTYKVQLSARTMFSKSDAQANFSVKDKSTNKSYLTVTLFPLTSTTNTTSVDTKESIIYVEQDMEISVFISYLYGTVTEFTTSSTLSFVEINPKVNAKLDENTLIKNEDNALEVKGFKEAPAGSFPMKTLDGKMEWKQESENNVDYGYFVLSSNQVTNLTDNSKVAIDKKLAGNMDISNNTVKVKKGKAYKIYFSTQCEFNTNTGSINMLIKDFNAKWSSKYITVNPVTSTEKISSSSSVGSIYEAKEDGEIGVAITWNVSNSCSKILSDRTVLIIEEIPKATKLTVDELIRNDLEYGHFMLSNNLSTPAVQQKIPLDTAISGNMTINDGKIKVKAGKTYEITYNAFVQFNETLGSGAFCCAIKSSNSDAIELKNMLYPAHRPVSFHDMPCQSIIYTPKIDCDIWLEVIDSINVYALRSDRTNLLIKEIKNNQVVQYGGFDSKVLFEGTANEVGDYTLSDSISNYDYLIITRAANYSSGENNLSQSSLTVEIENIFIGDTRNLLFNSLSSMIIFGFNNFNSFSIRSISKESSWASNHIYKIVGYKGKVDQLISGGGF